MENLNIPNLPVIQTRIPNFTKHLDESTSDESIRPVASSTPGEELNRFETIPQ